jgi:hypothetical protein
MSGIASEVQDQARYLLGMRGGPAIEPFDGVQAVVELLKIRQPQLELGPTIPRRFVAEDAVAAVVAEFAQVSIRTTDDNVLLLVDEVIIDGEPGAVSAIVGIAPNTELLHTQAGVARYEDMRLPGVSLVASPIDIGGDTAVGTPTRQGRRRVTVVANSTLIMSGPWILTNRRESGSSAPEGLGVTSLAANTSLVVAFTGWVFSWGSGTR